MVEAPNKEKGELPYPNSPVKVGDVLELSDTTTINGKTVYYKKYPPIHLEVDMLNDFPHIFRPMHWSEDRALGEMPRWVRLRDGSRRVCEVTEWVKSKSRFYTVLSWGNTGGQYWAHMVTPATEAEYLEYLKSKNNESIKRNSRTAERCKI